jgi:hypothetical protein
MKLNVITLDGAEAGTIDLDEALFGLEPRADILHRVVRWQRAKAQAGTHSTLTRADVSYSTKKIYRNAEFFKDGAAGESGKLVALGGEIWGGLGKLHMDVTYDQLVDTSFLAQ